jgi:hypothetical protein
MSPVVLDRPHGLTPRRTPPRVPVCSPGHSRTNMHAWGRPAADDRCRQGDESPSRTHGGREDPRSRRGCEPHDGRGGCGFPAIRWRSCADSDSDGAGGWYVGGGFRLAGGLRMRSATVSVRRRCSRRGAYGWSASRVCGRSSGRGRNGGSGSGRGSSRKRGRRGGLRLFGDLAPVSQRSRVGTDPPRRAGLR